ncbi:MAG: amidohydrolase family protein [Thermoanaerobaculia bacterium]|nr:amidohydrolase family protein [Thermoanaerobaculia bacterium]
MSKHSVAIAKAVVAAVLLCIHTGCGTSAPPAEGASGIAIVDVDVISMDGRGILEGQTVLIEGDRIANIGPAELVRAPTGFRLIEGRGRWLMPGLVDTHTHVDDPTDLLLYLVNGVTTVVNLRGSEEHLELRKELALSERIGPRLLTCGPFIRGNEVDAMSVRSRVEEIAHNGYDCVKAYTPGWTEESYEALIEAVEEKDLLLIGHSPREIGLDELIEHRVQRIAHLEEIVYATPELDAWVESFEEKPYPEERDPRRALGGIIDDVARRLAEAQIAVAATEIVIDNYEKSATESGRRELASRPYTRYLDPLNRRSWASRTESDLMRFRQQVALQHALLEAFREHGVLMALGTDAATTSDLLVMPGWSVHEELRILVEAGGFTPYEALRQATVDAARYLGRRGEGVIAEGSRADLILLEANPLEDIRHSRKIAAVVVGGRWYDHASLDERLERRVERWRPVEELAAEADRLLEEGDQAGAARAYLRIADRYAEFGDEVESLVNRLGYRLIADERIDEAIEILTLNRDAFPDSANTWDSLAEAHLVRGDRAEAIRLYRRALEIDPSFSNPARMLREELGVEP